MTFHRFRNTWRPRLTLLILFLLPWQTCWMFGSVPIAGGENPFGILRWFLVEWLIVGVYVLDPFAHHTHKRHGLVMAMWGVLLVGVLSVPFAVSPELAVMAWLHLLCATLLGLLLLDERLHWREALCAFALGLVGPTLLGIWEVARGVGPASTWLGLAGHDPQVPGTSVVEVGGSRWLRAYGSFPHPNVFGGYLAMGLGAVWIWAEEKHPYAWRVAALGLNALFGIGLVVSFSRSAWMATLLLLGSLIWGLSAFHRPSVRRLVPFAGALLVSVALAVWMVGPAIGARLEAQSRLETQSLEERMNGWESWKQVGTHRRVFGVGMGNDVVVRGEQFPGNLPVTYQPTHQVGLLVLGEVGVVGGVAWLLVLVAVWGSLKRRFPRALAISAVAWLLGLLMLGVFDHYLWSMWAGLALLFSVGALAVRVADERVVP